MPVGDNDSVRAAKALALPTRSAILSHLLSSGPLTAKEVSDTFSLHANVARAHLDLLVDAGFLATGIRRQAKGRPSKVYFTWEGEMSDPDAWEVSPAEEDAFRPVAPAALTPADPYRLLSRLLMRTVGGIDRSSLYAIAGEAAIEEGSRLVSEHVGSSHGFAEAIEVVADELSRFSSEVAVVSLGDSQAELRTTGCALQSIALEHSDLVLILDPSLKAGAMRALGHEVEVETVSSVGRGDPICREIVRMKG